MILEGKSTGSDLLQTIVAATRRVVEVREARDPLASVARRAERRAPRPGAFRTAVSRAGDVNIIAECKRRSPSRGVLCPEYDPVRIARGYADAGAAAISVLTEPTFFDGSLEHLAAVRSAVATPLLRKDFIVSEYQLFEARESAADAVLLIVAALSRGELHTLARRARALGLDVLVEVHDLEELRVAADTGADIIGVNNRNLRTIEVDLNASDQLIAGMPRDVVAISESGLKDVADLARLRDLGYDAFLIGERFMTEADPGAALRGFRASAVARGREARGA
jgi:indole-3-glycerol phosphate synthase